MLPPRLPSPRQSKDGASGDLLPPPSPPACGSISCRPPHPRLPRARRWPRRGPCPRPESWARTRALETTNLLGNLGPVVGEMKEHQSVRSLSTLQLCHPREVLPGGPLRIPISPPARTRPLRLPPGERAPYPQRQPGSPRRATARRPAAPCAPSRTRVRRAVPRAQSRAPVLSPRPAPQTSGGGGTALQRRTAGCAGRGGRPAPASAAGPPAGGGSRGSRGGAGCRATPDFVEETQPHTARSPGSRDLVPRESRCRNSRARGGAGPCGAGPGAGLSPTPTPHPSVAGPAPQTGTRLDPRLLTPVTSPDLSLGPEPRLARVPPTSQMQQPSFWQK